MCGFFSCRTKKWITRASAQGVSLLFILKALKREKRRKEIKRNEKV
jgi:hypothetical protein